LIFFIWLNEFYNATLPCSGSWTIIAFQRTISDFEVDLANSFTKRWRNVMTGFTKRFVTRGSILGLLTAAGAPARAATTVISPSNLGSWNVYTTDSSGVIPSSNPTGTADFVVGPAVPPLGIGSLHLATGNGTTGGDGSAQARDTEFAGVRVADITALSYSTYITSNNGQQAPYLTLWISTTGGATSDDRLIFEPPYSPAQGAVALNTWQTWNALTGGWYDDNGTAGSGMGVGNVRPLSTFIAAFPNATIVNPTPLGGVRLAAGFVSDFEITNTYVDNFTLNTAAASKTFDFEPSAAVPEPASLVSGLLSIAICLGGLLVRHRGTPA
jgi:hypothetical protein